MATTSIVFRNKMHNSKKVFWEGLCSVYPTPVGHKTPTFSVNLHSEHCRLSVYLSVCDEVYCG